MKNPYMTFPMTDDIADFIEEIEDKYNSGTMTTKEYHVALGKALAYAEAQFATDQISKDEALDLIDEIGHRLNS